MLGAIFFGGLWWTINKSISSKQPALWFLASSILRTVFVLAGFYIIGSSNWQRLPICLLGFFIAKLVFIYLTGASRSSPTEEAVHAP
jgi:F1F0 ATPase subunit 2